MRCHLCQYICDKSLQSLIIHWRTFHSLIESSEYECSLVKCGRRFSSLNSFKRHFKSKHASHFVRNTDNVATNTEIISLDENSIESDRTIERNTSPCKILDNEFNDSSVPSTSNNVDSDAEPSFSNIFQHEILRMIMNLYSMPNIPRNIVQVVVEQMDNIAKVPMKMMQNKVEEICIESGVPLNRRNEISSMFEVFGSVLQENRSEYLRFKKLRQLGIMIDPTSEKIGEEFEAINGKNVPKNRYSQVISLRQLLQSFLETEGVLGCMLEYMSSLNSSNTVISNIMQGEVFRNTLLEFQGKIVIPVTMSFDDWEPGNCLGSHSGIQKIGGAYIFLHSVPPQYRSNLENIFLAMLVNHEDHKKNGNRVVFSKLIEEFNYLADTGILVETKTKKVRIYFVLALLEGDNLGLNTVLGYSQSFSANHYCRICKLHKLEAQYTIRADNTALRTEANYDADIENNDFSDTGIKEACALNDVRHYHCNRNVIVDLMHDLPEGVLAYETGMTFHQLILVDKMIDFDIFNSILLHFDY